MIVFFDIGYSTSSFTYTVLPAKGFLISILIPLFTLMGETIVLVLINLPLPTIGTSRIR
jgi:hypothetical protein